MKNLDSQKFGITNFDSVNFCISKGNQYGNVVLILDGKYHIDVWTPGHSHEGSLGVDSLTRAPWDVVRIHG